MKKVFCILMIVLATNTSFSQQIQKVKITDVLKMADTSSVPLVINFWATWCQPCVHELPWFQKTVNAYKDKHVKLLLVSLDFPDDYPKAIADFIKKNKYTADVVWLNETDANYFCAKVDRTWEGTIPVTLMVNNSKHYRQFFNQQLPEARLKQEIQKLVE
ncbi:alkyl hydroperoxide reductase/ thiol specific antioxidant/ Mal allergen [Russula earlei]|uniref:Alkyl hydroperoxide reductase/ thiol specific antioxidant/ Mal allergen n=1 Tax=Russula earlei TaxID=71964 RepID=A0ACC0TUR4_9AGAM|nr:alkyl hydroperoxide reductase/ thiol specific antioxidant/ Mal allergen [Russula earlei]